MIATQWTSETLHAEDVTVCASVRQATVSVEADVPRDAAGTRCPSRGNRYWPTIVSMHFGAPEEDAMPMLAEEARALAIALLRAVAIAETHDVKDSDVCGHWAPCDCPAAKAGAA